MSSERKRDANRVRKKVIFSLTPKALKKLALIPYGEASGRVSKFLERCNPIDKDRENKTRIDIKRLKTTAASVKIAEQKTKWMEAKAKRMTEIEARRLQVLEDLKLVRINKAKRLIEMKALKIQRRREAAELRAKKLKEKRLRQLARGNAKKKHRELQALEELKAKFMRQLKIGEPEQNTGGEGNETP